MPAAGGEPSGSPACPWRATAKSSTPTPRRRRASSRTASERASSLLYVGRERNVSGGANLANRPELSRAVEAVEAGNADIIVAAYFDRFFRSLEVQGEVIGRIERAGGELLTLDHGRLTNGTPANRLQANIVGAMAQFFREQTAEKSAAGQAAAVARGATPWARIPLGYTRERQAARGRSHEADRPARVRHARRRRVDQPDSQVPRRARR